MNERQNKMFFLGCLTGIFIFGLSCIIYSKIKEYKKMHQSSNIVLLKSLYKLFTKDEDFVTIKKCNTKEVEFTIPHNNKMFDLIEYYKNLLKEYIYIGCYGVVFIPNDKQYTVIKIELKNPTDEFVGFLRIQGIL